MFLGCRLVGLMVTFLGVSLTKKLVARSIPNINISIQDLLRSVFLSNSTSVNNLKCYTYNLLGSIISVIFYYNFVIISETNAI